jgi:hypothetical protein
MRGRVDRAQVGHVRRLRARRRRRVGIVGEVQVVEHGAAPRRADRARHALQAAEVRQLAAAALPKMPPTSDAIATTSSSLNGCGSC